MNLKDKFEITSNFRIKKITNYSNISFYYIEDVKTNLKLISSSDNKLKFFFKLKKIENNLDLWTFIEKKKNNYIIQNKNKCYLKVIKSNILCENIIFEEASDFELIKIYEEIEENKVYKELIEKEPIDIVIKYIDLRDQNLKRDGISQIKKDFDNEELRYSIRSITKNLPWVRKIFILMPNKKVRFFKDYNNIKDKIIYIKDKDFLGYDSSNSYAFQFRFWKLEKFGISNNFIAMDDDYFIGSPLKKDNFFYVKNGKVTPAIITSKFLMINNNTVKNKLKKYKDIIRKTNINQTSEIFLYSQYLTYSFLLSLFNKTLIIPKFTHNAIPVNIKELKEIYDLIYQSDYKYATLDCLYRHIETLQFQTLILSYSFIKYNKKVKKISFKYIPNTKSIIKSYNYSLFCINTGAENSSKLSFMKTRIVMEYLFPIPSPYEKKTNYLPDLAFNTILLLEKEFRKKNKYITYLKEQINKLKNKIWIIIFVILIYTIHLKIILNSKKYK